MSGFPKTHIKRFVLNLTPAFFENALKPLMKNRVLGEAAHL
jgi:hypothetical protein